jgi:hypothetical protein
MTPKKATSKYLNADKVSRVIRRPPSETLLKAAATHFEQRMTGELERELESIKSQVQHLGNISAPLRTLIERDSRAVASLHALDQLAHDDQKQRVDVFEKRSDRGSLQTFSFTANPGFQIIAPPYDLDWSSEGNALPLWGADKNTGQIKVFSGNGAAGAAIGVYLSSPDRSLAHITPFAPFTYQWSGFDFNVPAWCNGSVGVVVYVDGDPRPAYDYRAALWNAHFDFPGFRDKGSWSSTISRDLPRDVLITMEPSSSYQVWVWCSVVAHSFASEAEGKAGTAFGGIDCDVPFMIVDAGPAPNIR